MVPNQPRAGKMPIKRMPSLLAAIDLRTRRVLRRGKNGPKSLFLLGERGGTRTLDPMIKSHVLYRLSYALTCRAV